MGTESADDIPRGELFIYTTPDGFAQTEDRLEYETAWLTLKQLVELFESTQQDVSLHIKTACR